LADSIPLANDPDTDELSYYASLNVQSVTKPKNWFGLDAYTCYSHKYGIWRIVEIFFLKTNKN
jgi:hypothetical protein